MKKVYFILLSAVIIAGGMFLQSCANDNDKDWHIDRYVDSEEANFIALSFLRIEEGKYVLDLTAEKARELDISAEDFLRMTEEIRQVNYQIARWIKEEIPHTLTDPALVRAKYTFARFCRPRLRSEIEPGVTVQGGPGPSRRSAFIPSNARSIGVSVSLTTRLVDNVSVSVSASGSSPVFRSGTTVRGRWSSSLTPPHTNVTGQFEFTTWDPMGGTAHFTFETSP